LLSCRYNVMRNNGSMVFIGIELIIQKKGLPDNILLI
jgi:hypothetical protein